MHVNDTTTNWFYTACKDNRTHYLNGRVYDNWSEDALVMFWLITIKQLWASILFSYMAKYVAVKNGITGRRKIWVQNVTTKEEEQRKIKAVPSPHPRLLYRLCMAASSSKRSSSRFLCGRLFVMPRHYLRLMENYENVMPFWESCCHLHVQTERVFKINTGNWCSDGLSILDFISNKVTVSSDPCSWLFYRFTLFCLLPDAATTIIGYRDAHWGDSRAPKIH